MLLDTALNVAWLAIALGALASLALAERRRAGTPGSRMRRLCAVLVVTFALFPAVSTSDDLFSFSLIDIHLGKHGGLGSTPPETSKEKAGMQLFRLLETLDHYQVARIQTVALSLSCLSLVHTSEIEATTRSVVRRPGRAPPSA